MTTTRTPSGRASTVLVHRDHIVTGTAAQLANVMANHHTAGTLISHGQPVPTPDGRLQMQIRVTERVSRPSTRRVHSVGDYTRARARRRARTGRRVAVVTAAALVVLAGVGYALYEVVQLVTAYWPWILGVLVALVLAGARLGRASAVHCPGCPR